MPQSQQQQQQEQSQMADLQDSEASCVGSDGLTTTLLLPGVKLRGPQPPPVNPLKFIKVSPPVNMYKAPPVREAPPPVEIKKEEPEDWQNDLEGWKFNRRKRQEHLMERVSEIKKLEEEQSNSSSRRNKTFSEMMKNRKSSIVVYDDANENDFSDLGLGGQTPSNNNDDEVFESPESEITYEKAIQGYVDFASSRANKPFMATGSASQINETNIISKISRKQNFDNGSSEVSIQQTRSIISSPRHAQKSEDYTFINDEATIIPENDEPKSPIKEKISLMEKISMFERTTENFSSSKSHTVNFEINEDSSLTQSKKLAPPVPAKPKAAVREESQLEVSLAPIKEDSVVKDSSFKHFELRDYVEERTSETLRPECRELDQSLALSDDSSNVEADAPEVCAVSLKLNNSLEHVPHRDIQRSPLGGEDSGVHTADSVSQSDEVEEDEELASQVEDGMSGLLGILSSQVPIIDTELSALLAPPLRLEPPREKPPPPPPVCPEPDTETMRKNFLGLEVTCSQPAPQMKTCDSTSSTAIPPPDTSSPESDCLGTQLKERLLKLEEEKNNIINMEKHLKVEQENLAFEREALRIEREAIASKKQAAFAKKLAVRSLESLDIPPLNEVENRETTFNGNEPEANKNNEISPQISPRKSEPIPTSIKNNVPQYFPVPTVRKSLEVEEVTSPPIKHQSPPQQTYPTSPKHQSPETCESRQTVQVSQQPSVTPRSQPQVYQQQTDYSVSQQYYSPPKPWYSGGGHSKQYYDDTQANYYEPQQQPLEPTIIHASQGAWTKQTNFIQAGPPIRKKGPPPPAKPSRMVVEQKNQLTRNYSADSILESVDGDAPVVLRRNKGNGSGGRSSLHYNLGGSMSQLPVSQQPRSRPSSQGINYQHWLVQEAEHRRITEQQQRQAASNPRQPKHLPDAIILSLTQRVQHRQSQGPPPAATQLQQVQQQPQLQQMKTSPPRNSIEDKVLSVSGKKKCSHCNLELGRGAAMVIESLRLFYHIDCFKCCVCCIQLGDGLMGTDVRVRNGKLHCHSCYSSDDGVKFSCV